MKVLKFKTNFSCGGCLRTASGFLDDVDGLVKWDAEWESEDNVLTVEMNDTVEAKAVIDAVEEAGYDISVLN